MAASCKQRLLPPLESHRQETIINALPDSVVMLLIANSRVSGFSSSSSSTASSSPSSVTLTRFSRRFSTDYENANDSLVKVCVCDCPVSLVCMCLYVCVRSLSHSEFLSQTHAHTFLHACQGWKKAKSPFLLPSLPLPCKTNTITNHAASLSLNLTFLRVPDLASIF